MMELLYGISVPQAGFEPTFYSVTAHKVEACAGTGAHNTPLGCVVELAAGLEPASSNYYHTDSESVEIRKQTSDLMLWMPHTT